MSIRYELHGCRGTVFDLTGATSPVRLVDDPDGLDGPPHDAAMQENVNQGGAYFKGQQDKPNPITLRYRFGGAVTGLDAAGLQDAASSWRNNLGTGRELAEFHVIDDAAGSDRWQWVRNQERHTGVPRSALRDRGWWGKGQVVLTSDSSYWSSEALDVNALTEATITNAGDFPAWPQWEITGPTTGLKIGLGADAIALANITSGHTYLVDTDPTCPRIYLDGVDAWGTAAGRQSFRVPAAAPVNGVPVATPISVTGTAAAVRLVLPQQYWAALG